MKLEEGIRLCGMVDLFRDSEHPLNEILEQIKETILEDYCENE